MIKDKKFLVILFLAVTYILVFGALSSLKHLSFNSHAMDLGLYSNSMWNSLNGRLLYNSVIEGSHFKSHFSPILIALIPFYFLFQSPITLLVIQTIIIGLALIPFYLIAKRNLDEASTFVLVFSFLLFPSLHYINLFDFHTISFAILFIFCLLYYLDSNDKKFLLFAIICLMIREDVALLISFLGLFIVFKRKNKTLGVTVFIAGMIALALALFLLYSLGGEALPGEIWFSEFYPNAGESVSELINPLLLKSKAVYLFKLFSPTLFISFFSPFTLLMGLPAFLENLFSIWKPMFSTQFQYDSIVIPFIYFSAVSGLKKIKEKLKDKRILGRNAFTLVLTGIILSSLASFCFFSPVGPINFGSCHECGIEKDAYAITEHDLIGHEIIASIPADASISSQIDLMPHLANRPESYVIPNINRAEYVFFDLKANKWPLKEEEYHKLIEEIIESKEYGIILFNDGYALFKRNTEDNAESLNKIQKYLEGD